jgi:hypothetical protein
MNTSGPSAKRTSSQLSNSKEETVMKDIETVTNVQDNEEDVLSKRNKTRTGEEDDTEDDNLLTDSDDEMAIEKLQQDDPMKSKETTNSSSGSFIDGFNNQQFKSTANNTPSTGVSQH